MVTLAQVAEKLAVKARMNNAFAVTTVAALLDVFADALAEGETIHLGSFGELRVREVKAHDTMNPGNPGKRVHIPDWRRPYFQPYRKLLKRMNPNGRFK